MVCDRVFDGLPLWYGAGSRGFGFMCVCCVCAGPPEVEDFHTLYIVTQLYECDLERIVSSPQRLTDQHCQYFVYQLLRGLKFIHSANVLHRDLKPSNLLVNSNCDLCICDFGLARGVGDEATGKLTEYVVTRWYRAPELLCEADTYGTAVDVWSVGCIFAEILGRKPLFRGSSTSDQLRLVIEKLGSPTDDELTLIHGEDVLKQIRSMPFRPKVCDTVACTCVGLLLTCVHWLDRRRWKRCSLTPTLLPWTCWGV